MTKNVNVVYVQPDRYVTDKRDDLVFERLQFQETQQPVT